jgi:hypothetical protein
MNHGLMNGMFWAGVLISAIPVVASIGADVMVWRAWHAERIRDEATKVAQKEALP